MRPISPVALQPVVEQARERSLQHVDEPLVILKIAMENCPRLDD